VASKTVQLKDGKRQKTQLELDFSAEPRGEALRSAEEVVEPSVAKHAEESPVGSERLMEEVCERENCLQALARVKSNGGSAGIDGMTVGELTAYLKEHWLAIKETLLAGNYKPQPVRRVEIPKPDGGKRKLGIPTVVDRFIQQAVMQVLQKRWDPTFSKSSYGFRPGRSAHQAVSQAAKYLKAGYQWVVDIDLEKFFDRVNHDRLMAALAERITDKRMLRLIRAFLTAGVMEDGLVSPVDEGTPQGGPLSPLLSNVVLDELDRELERRGRRFVRYADDCNIYVRSRRAGDRVMASLNRFITERLRLKVNASKSAVARPWERKFLGFTFATPYYGVIKVAVAPKAVERFKERIRQLTARRRGVSLEQMVKDLSRYLKGWRGYFGFAQTRFALGVLDGWVRRRLRCYLWAQWRNGFRRVEELMKLGVGKSRAKMFAKCHHGPWRLSLTPMLNTVLPPRYFDSIGLPRLIARG
jgi:RNA-directed DNA polymerase